MSATESTQPDASGAPDVVVIDDSEAEQERKRELEQRIDAQGGFGDVPIPRGKKGSAAGMIAQARRDVGYRESGNNDTKFNRWLGRIGGYPHDGFGYPWCHSFVSYCLWHSDNAGAGPRTAGCVAGASWFKARGRFHSTPQPGDLVYYGANGGTHVELVTAVTEGTIQTVGGNTSGSLAGNFFNGNGVYAKTVDRRSSRIHGYGRPEYGSTDAGFSALQKPMTSVRSIKQQQQAVNGLGHDPPLVVDGEWGPKTYAGVRWLQKKVGAAVDAEWGEQTERKYQAFVAKH
jgi:hypothetical protein